ncbi:hypothetical protein MBLNU459_g6656t1 [Dothideomycetes sp. NU459]
MGYDYALVHVKYTIPPAIALTLFCRPFLTRLDVYKILFLITIAVASTTPWDSYLIRTNIWSYPENVIIGPKLFDIPLEEVFFFVIQTYNTALLYLLLSKPTFHPVYLRHEPKSDPWKYYKLAGQLGLALAIKKGLTLVKEEKEGMYLGLILVWAVPFLLLLWSLAYQFVMGLPLTNTLLPIALPTTYLWIVDTLALKRGTWVIESGTKLGRHLWPGLEIEEAVFFLLTNTLIVFGLVAFDNAMAVLNAFPFHYPSVSSLPSPLSLVRALLLPASAYDEERIEGLKHAVQRLRQKSRSFYLASAVFPGRLRIDMTLLYSFCRVADDLVDNAASPAEARKWIKHLSAFVNLSYKGKGPEARDANIGTIVRYVVANFPRDAHSALLQLPTEKLSPEPLYDLLAGFEMDLEFVSPKTTKGDDTGYPIKTEKDLDVYGTRVAGTVAQLCLELVFSHHPGRLLPAKRKDLIASGAQMGIALQYTNIARDLTVDASLGRIYIPTVWLKGEGLKPEQALKVISVLGSKEVHGKEDAPFAAKVERLRSKLLDRAFALYEDARPAIESLPVEARGPMRVAVESYMQIARTLRQKGYVVKNGRAGAGGVSTAARLAKAGFKVTVLEKNDFTGGRCSLLRHEGWRFDQGPSLLLLPGLFHRTFEELDTSLEREGVKLVKCEPNYNIWFGDGERFQLSTDLASMKSEIEKWEGKDGYSRYLGFLRESHEHYELSVTHVLLRNFTSVLSMMRPSFLKHLLALHPFESIYSRASKYFWTERLRRVFTFGSMYMGMSPFDAPGTYSLLQYTELAEGIWYPIGGFHEVIEALVKVGERLGVDYKLSTPISRIELSSDGSRATGVVLESGEILTADVIVNNADLVYTYNNLLPPTPYAHNLGQRPTSCSSISFYWALDRKVEELDAHNIFLADEYRESFDSIFKKHLIPDQPSFYVNVPSRADPSAAPEGKDTIVVLVPVGHLIDGEHNGSGASLASADVKERKGIQPTETQDWPRMIELARRTILSTIALRTGVDITPYIVHEITNDPMTWQDTFNLDRGAILGLSHSFFNVLSFRPATKARRGGWLDGKLGGGVAGRIGELLNNGGSIDRLYMVGASAHPGTGVPICLAGGKLVAEQVCEDLGVVVPWLNHQRETPQSRGRSIDKIQTLPVLSWIHWVFIFITLICGMTMAGRWT